MSNRTQYSVGDVFVIDLSNGLKGYGRILKINEPSLFIELYKVSPEHEQTLETIVNSESILSIWCSKHGITKGIWSIIGNISLKSEVKMPDFWKRDAFNASRIILVKGEHAFEETEEENSYEVTQDRIKEAQPYGIFGHDAVKIRYEHELKQQGLI
ncbi:immunity 26/phosphotriesterase HocA family protein [Gracilibacillus sp. YIM 98692]|uniref:immunity 26/phosphotriesterase HocA family protein n=1 Tax=Gracilibacillus sp. YIM 98692 TaxID=2663532 RepID=UPI0013D5415F|nr:immunity 26/phosphotriesterase HocA family protein [Gracilibacillus sp. YIM 98692]